jgi:hypothetical protein
MNNRIEIKGTISVARRATHVHCTERQLGDIGGDAPSLVARPVTPASRSQLFDLSTVDLK